MDSWQTKKLGEIAKVQTGPFGSQLHEKDYRKDGTPIITVENLVGDVVRLLPTTPKVSKSDVLRLKKYSLKEGDIVFSRVGAVDRSGYVSGYGEGWLFSGRLLCVRAGKEIFPKFLNYSLHQEKTKNLIRNMAVGGTMPSLNTSILNFAPVAYPNLAEQQRIVRVLEIWDEYIEKLERKIFLKEQLKSSLMRQLLTGERRPLGCTDEWQKIKLGDVGKVSMCKRIFKEQTLQTGTIPFYKIGTFGRKPDAFIPKAIYDEYRQKYPFPKKGDILISASGTIGRTVIYDDIPAYFQDSNIIWIANDEKKVLNSFLFYVYKGVKWQTASGTIARLYNANVQRVTFYAPSIGEQKRIAQILRSADEEISYLSGLRSLLLAQKQYLLKNLITGAIRTPENLTTGDSA